MCFYLSSTLAWYALNEKCVECSVLRVIRVQYIQIYFACTLVHCLYSSFSEPELVIKAYYFFFFQACCSHTVTETWTHTHTISVFLALWLYIYDYTWPMRDGWERISWWPSWLLQVTNGEREGHGGHPPCYLWAITESNLAGSNFLLTAVL